MTRGADVVFTPSPGQTVGVEWELGLVDADSLELVSRADELLTAVERPHAHLRSARDRRSSVTRELLTSTIELVTGVCANAAEASTDLRESLEIVHREASRQGLALFGGGTHPFAHWSTQEVSAGERYATLIDRTQFWGRQMVIFGVHVHVGVRSAAKVWPLINALLTYHPHLTALAASSPYTDRVDTGYASNRTMLFQQLPTAGLPFQFSGWGDYQAYLDDVFTTGVVDDVSELRWDIRPSPRIGTIEVRACDGLTSLEEVAAVTALVHCLTVHLEDQLDAGTLPPPLPPWHVQENKWRAARYGLEAIVITGVDNREVLVTEDLERVLADLAPTAERLGCERELHGIRSILEHGAGYQRQRYAVQSASGDLMAAAQAMVVTP